MVVLAKLLEIRHNVLNNKSYLIRAYDGLGQGVFGVCQRSCRGDASRPHSLM